MHLPTTLNLKLALCAGAVSLSFFAMAPLRAQTSVYQPGESSPPAKASTPHDKPIHHQWTLHRLDGSVILTVDPNGHWDFSGNIKDHLKGQVFDVTFILKGRDGKICAFQSEADATNGIVFDRFGNAAVIARDFSNFKDHHWSAVYTLHKNSGTILNLGPSGERRLNAPELRKLAARKDSSLLPALQQAMQSAAVSKEPQSDITLF